MTLRDWSFLLAAVGHLALAMLSVPRVAKSSLALPFTLLAFDLFGWTFAAFCNHRFGSPLWRAVDVVFTALTPPLVLYVVLAFVGRTRDRSRLLVGAFAVFGALSFASAAAFTSEAGRAWIESASWTALFLAFWLPTFGYELWLLVGHLRAGVDGEEQARTRLVLAAIFVGAAFAATDLVRDMGAALPPLAPIGTLASTSLVAVVALRFRLFERNVEGSTTLYALCSAAAAVLLSLALVEALSANLAALGFGVALVMLFLTAIVREATRSASAHKARMEKLAVLGRFSAQMAHDLKNPLAALVGAVQVIEGNAASRASANGELFALVLAQAARIRTIVDTYDRVGRVEPVLVHVALNDLVKRVTALQRYGAAQPLDVTLDLDESVGDCELDADLVSGALENLLRNAIEAMPSGGTIVVRTSRTKLHGRDDAVIVSVTDDGEGMDARLAERAFDDFYTTKATGSGLGLAFVRRVALAHGGEAKLRTKRGRGTTVELLLRV